MCPNPCSPEKLSWDRPPGLPVGLQPSPFPHLASVGAPACCWPQALTLPSPYSQAAGLVMPTRQVGKVRLGR